MLVPDTGGASGVRAVVMDFGLAKQRRAGPDLAKLTATGIVLGTPEFMSPEQIRGKQLDGRSDVYATGILAFELFTGQLPFSGKSAQETMIARLRGSPRRLRGIREELPGKLEAVIERCLAIDASRSVSDHGGAGICLRGRYRNRSPRASLRPLILQTLSALRRVPVRSSGQTRIAR